MSKPVDRPTFEHLVAAHHRDVYAAAVRIVRDSQAAEDIAQQLFLQVLQGRVELADARDPGRVLRWLAGRAALMHLRTDRNRRRREEARAMELNSERNVEHAMGDDEAGALWSHVAALPEVLQRAVLLRFHEGLTFDAIGAFVGCSGPTAHDRVKRALAALRARLGGTAFASLMPALENHLGEATTATAPAALGAKLAALTATATAATSVSALWAAAAVLVVVSTASYGVWSAQRGGDAGGAGAASAPQVRAPGAAAVIVGDTARVIERAPIVTTPFRGEPPVESALDAAAAHVPMPGAGLTGAAEVAGAVATETGTITGRIVDEQNAPVAGIEVTAHSTLTWGKEWRFAKRTRTDAAGAYRLDVPVEAADGQEYVVVCRHEDRIEEQSAAFRVAARAVVARPDMTVYSNSSDRVGDFQLTVRVTDAGGLPVPRVGVGVHRRLKTAKGWDLKHEAGAAADEHGMVVLEGHRLGDKMLVVDGEWLGYLVVRETLPITQPGAHSHTVSIRQGAVIEGTLTSGSGRAVKAADVHATDAAAERWFTGTVDPEGHFHIGGLADGVYTLHVTSDVWSPVAIPGIVAGRRDLQVVLKRADDPRDIGQHMAEIHARIVDAATGAPVPVSVFDVDVWTVQLDAQGALDPNEYATLLTPRPVQRMATSMHRAGDEDAGDVTTADEGAGEAAIHRTGFTAGTYLMIVYARGYAAAFAGPFTLGAHEIKSGLTVALHRGGTVAGRVVDAAGHPVPRAVVVVVGPGAHGAVLARTLERELQDDRERALRLRPSNSVTDDDGRFQLPGLPPDVPLAVMALHADFAASDGVPLAIIDGKTTTLAPLVLGAARAR